MFDYLSMARAIGSLQTCSLFSLKSIYPSEVQLERAIAGRAPSELELLSHDEGILRFTELSSPH